MINSAVFNNRTYYAFATIALCFFIGKSIAAVPTSVPLMAVAGAVLFFIGFVNTNLAVMLLIGAMLLSPEFSVAKIPGRDVVLRIEDLLIVIFTVSWLMRLALVKKSGFIVRTPLNRNILFFSIVFILVTLRGMLLEYVNPLKGTFFALKYLQYFMFYFFACSVLQSKNQVRLYIKAFLITYIVVSFYAMSQIGFQGRVSAPFEGEGEPNTLGGYLVLLQAIILGMTVHLKMHKHRVILGALFFLSLLPFVFTFSRASYLAFLPMYFVVVFFNRTRKRNILIGALIVTVVLGVFFFPQNVKNRLAHTFIPEATIDAPPQSLLGIQFGPSASARMFSWKIMTGRWKQSPFLGYGVTGQGFIDGQYIRTLVEMGAVGMIAFILLLVALYKNTLRIYKTSKDDLYKGLSLGFLAGHVGLMVHAISTNTFILIRIMEPYWFLAGMVMTIPKIEQMEMPKFEGVKEKTKKVFRNTDRLLSGTRVKLKTQ